MPQSPHPDHPREQSGGSVTWLQRPLYVGDGTSGDAVSSRVHVPCDTAAAELYEQCWTTTVGANTFPHRHTSHLPHLQEKFQVSLYIFTLTLLYEYIT